MYEFACGPLLWISLALFVAGFIYRATRLFRLTEEKRAQFCQVTAKKDAPAPGVSAEEQKLEKIARFNNSVLARHPVMVIVSAVFHLCLALPVLFLMAHNILIAKSIGLRLPSVPDGLADFMTIVVLACGLFFLVRRIAVPKVAAISSSDDYGALFLTMMPFLTGFLAHHQLFDYKTVLTIHAFAGDIVLIALPFTKIGHMVFFFFARFALGGEHCIGRGNRIWST
jgi:nitrate reductase gamma subunit